MIGTVYLCQINDRFVALKMSAKAMSITGEVNVLKSLNKVQDNRLGPFLLDVDDWETPLGDVYSFYVMEYIQGISMTAFINQNGYEWIGVFLIQMLEQLETLHRSGWVFGDLKNDNILIAQSPPAVRFIDVGGTTKVGRSVKEYSEFYDRAYWGMGTRKAEPGYDLFAVVMVILHVFYPQQFKRNKNPKQLILQRLHAVTALKRFRRCLQKAILGKYTSASEMKNEVLQIMATELTRINKNIRRKRAYLGEAVFVAIVSGIYYVISLLLL